MANTKTKEVTKKKFGEIPENVDVNDIVMVRNGFAGRLVYVSPKTKEEYIWDSFGDEVEMDIKELRTAKSSQKKFFEYNWFMFDDEYSWVIPYLGVAKMYENSISIDDIDNILSKSPTEVKRLCGKLNDGQRKTMIYMVKKLFADGDIDSLKIVSALEDGLGISLTDR